MDRAEDGELFSVELAEATAANWVGATKDARKPDATSEEALIPESGWCRTCANEPLEPLEVVHSDAEERTACEVLKGYVGAKQKEVGLTIAVAENARDRIASLGRRFGKSPEDVRWRRCVR